MLLTFDDGPVDHGQTKALLDVMRAHDVRGAFCLIGNRIPLAPDVCRQLVADGHLVVNHTERHLIPFLLTHEQLKEDILRGDQSVADCIGKPFRSQYFRPPGGLLTPKTRLVMREMGLKILPLTYFAWDTMRAPDFLRVTLPQHILSHARWHGGGIFLVHEALCPLSGKDTFKVEPDRTWVPEAVDRLITGAKKRGFAFPEPLEVLEYADETIQRMVEGTI